MIAVETRKKAPYHTVVTHGMVVDAEGKKMSKSLGNYIDPEDIIKTLGAEICVRGCAWWITEKRSGSEKRLWIVFQKHIVKSGISFRYLLSNLYDFNPDTDSVAVKKLEPLDRWAMHQLSDLTNRVKEAYERYEYHVVYHSIYRFCVVEMSAFYLDISKDRL